MGESLWCYFLKNTRGPKPSWAVTKEVLVNLQKIYTKLYDNPLIRSHTNTISAF